MNKELALRTFAYLKTHYQTNNETLISKEDIEAIDFILNENEQLTNLINEYENKGYDIATERADFLLEIQHLQQELQRKDNIINEIKNIINRMIYDGYTSGKDNAFIFMATGENSEFGTRAKYILNKIKELEKSK